MKKIIFLVSILISLVLFAKEEKDFIKMLEYGDIYNAEQIIVNVKNEDMKNFYTAIYYMYTGDYNTAEEYMLKISSDIKISDQEMFFVKYIPYLAQTFSSGYKKYESEHFEVYLKDRDIVLSDLILKVLEQIYKFYGQKFGCYPEKKVRVEVYNTKKEFSIASTLGEEIVEKTGVVGICKFNRIMVLSPECLPFGYRWCDTLAHEYTHFILNRITEFKYPLYLHEGTARYFDTLYRSTESLCFVIGNLNLLLEAKKKNELIPFEKMKGSLVYLDSQQQVELAFAELSTFVEYLINNFGEGKFIEFVKNYKNYDKEERLYKEIFGIEFKNILSGWYENIDKKEELVKKYPGAVADFKLTFAEDEKSLVGLDMWQYIELGDKFFSNKNYNVALYQYKKAQKQQPYNPVVMTRIAKCYILQNKYDDAEKVLQECSFVNPNYVTTYELLVKLFYEKGEYEKAMKYYEDVLQINPFNWEIHKIVAQMLTDLGKIKDAVKKYEIVLLLNPTDTETKITYENIKRYLENKK
jgi:tetratricopeptide (TPR) repeat protein